MKVSLAWLFDHIDADLQSITITDLVDRFNQTTAEIESWRVVDINLSHLAAIQITECSNGRSIGWCPEWDKEIAMSARDDLYEGGWFVVAKEDETYRWATTIDFGGEKNMLVPAIRVQDSANGSWKKGIETHDIILDVDNKSITHRPDLWGHRGLAREIAAMFNLPLIPLEKFLAQNITTIQKDSRAAADTHSPFSVEIDNTQLCHRFATYFINDIEYTASLPWMMSRLARVDSRSIDALVDGTNYVMQDLSQPMHAFDAGRLENKELVVRAARNKAELTLLDGQTIELTDQDIIIADGRTPISLAGIMGGDRSSICAHTKQVLLESAHFNPTAIRKSAMYHKIRTEASARFEKDLDPNQNIDALLRFIQLLNQAQIAYSGSSSIISLGKPAEPVGITLSQQYIEDRLGCSVASSFIVDTLSKLGFQVDPFTQEGGSMSYLVLVPTYRATKDVTIPEDIVEEVGRFYGYDNLPQTPPLIPARSTDMHVVNRVREMKSMCAYGLQMHELENYALYDESFLQEIGWQPEKAVGLKNPVSENWQHLVTSLIPHLLKAVQQNAPHHAILRFFEWGRVWEQTTAIQERKRLSGIFFEKEPLDFYDLKKLLTRFFDRLDLSVTWEQVANPTEPWFAPYQTAHVLHDGDHIGTVGIMHASMLEKVAQGHALLFDFDGDALLNYKKPAIQCKPLAKYPEVERDISLLVPNAVTVQELQTVIQAASSQITDVALIDFFTKDEWQNQKALTFRFVMVDEAKTMTKQEVDAIYDKVSKAMEAAGAEVR